MRGSYVVVSMDLPPFLIRVVLRDSGKTRGVQFRPWITTGTDYHHPTYILSFKEPPEQRGPTEEIWKI